MLTMQMTIPYVQLPTPFRKLSRNTKFHFMVTCSSAIQLTLRAAIIEQEDCKTTRCEH